MKTDEPKTLTSAPGASLRAVAKAIDYSKRQIEFVVDEDNEFDDYSCSIGRLEVPDAARFEFDTVFRA